MRIINVTMWVDLDEHLYHANIDNGPMPDAECNTFDELQQWVHGFKMAAEMCGATVQVVDETE
jgi:hypothetical protein